MSQAMIDVMQERERQRQKHGDDKDDRYTGPALAHAAAAYLLGSEALYPFSNVADMKSVPRRLALVRAAALVIAEIGRLDRLPPPPIVVDAVAAGEVVEMATDDALDLFVAQCVIVGTGGYVSAAAMYRAYLSWRNRHSKGRLLSPETFVLAMGSRTARGVPPRSRDYRDCSLVDEVPQE